MELGRYAVDSPAAVVTRPAASAIKVYLQIGR